MKSETEVLTKFLHVDKYKTFGAIMPEVCATDPHEKAQVVAILDDCCSALLRVFRPKRRPGKVVLRKILVLCMDRLTLAEISNINRDFGYQLGWYLSEKVGLDLKKGSEKKTWGYWELNGNRVCVPLRPRISAEARSYFSDQRQADKNSAS